MPSEETEPKSYSYFADRMRQSLEFTQSLKIRYENVKTKLEASEWAESLKYELLHVDEKLQECKENIVDLGIMIDNLDILTKLEDQKKKGLITEDAYLDQSKLVMDNFAEIYKGELNENS